MKNLLSFLLLTSFVCVSLAARAESAKAVIKDYGTELKKETPNYPPLVVKSTQAIEAMSNTLTASEAADVIALLQLNEATDPGRTLFDDVSPILKRNKAALKAALKKLPKKEADDLIHAIDVAIKANEEGQDH